METFKEKQRFTQWWIWLILLLPPLAVVVALGIEFNSKTGVSTDSVLGFLLLLLVNLALFFVRLETRIEPAGISARLFPFHLKFRTYSWNDLESIQVRKYNPIGEFGGWGYRSWGGKKGNAWNISGNRGIQLKFKSGRDLLIGTQKPAEVQDFLKRLNIQFPDLNIPLVEGDQNAPVF